MKRNPTLPTHHSWADLQRLSFHDPLIATVLTCSRDHAWTREETLLIMVTAMMQSRDECQKAYEREILTRTVSGVTFRGESP